MGYSREYNEEKFEYIERKLLELEDLPKGSSILVDCESEKMADRLAWRFRDYFNLLGLKPLYFTSKVRDKVVVGKYEKPSLSNVRRPHLHTPTIGEAIDTQVKELIESPSPREAIAVLATNNSITLTGLALIVEEYARVMGD